MLLQSTKKILFFTAIVFIIVLVAYAVFFFYIKGKNKAIAFLKEEIGSITKDDIERSYIKSMVENTEIERAKLDSYFIERDGIVDFIEVIENIADIASVSIEITSVNIKETDEYQDIIENLQIGIKTTGLWNDTFYFLSLVETLPFNIYVSRISLNKESVNDYNSELWNGVFNILAVKFK